MWRLFTTTVDSYFNKQLVFTNKSTKAKEGEMKVMAINSSPRGGGQSKTEWMMGHLVDGMGAAGAQVDVVNLRDKKINYCSGCFSSFSASAFIPSPANRMIGGIHSFSILLSGD